MLLFALQQIARKEKVCLPSQSFCRKTVFYRTKCFVKTSNQPINNEYLTKQTPQGALAGKQERMRRGT